MFCPQREAKKGINSQTLKNEMNWKNIKKLNNSNSTTYYFINLLISADIFLIISSFFSMFIITIIVAVAVVALISLIYLYINKIRKKCRKVIKTISAQISAPSLYFKIKSNFPLQQKKKHSSQCHFFSYFYILIIYVYQNDLAQQYFLPLYFLSISSPFRPLSEMIDWF